MFQLAKPYNNQDPTEWFMSEKYDGVRVQWRNGQFITRNNKTIKAPDFFIKEFPKDIVLDGELWAGRGLFQQTVAAVKKKYPVNREWSVLTYQVFDLPDLPLPFFKRRQLLPSAAYITPVLHHECENHNHLWEYYDTIVNKGGEGVMLNHPNAYYHTHRSEVLLKVKPELDSQALILDYLPGMGKHEGRIGALKCQWNNKVIIIGTGLSDQERTNPPKGIINFSYQCLTNEGMPRFPRYKGEAVTVTQSF